MQVYAYWWGVQLVPQNEEDEKAIDVIAKSGYVKGYDSNPSDNPIERVTPVIATRLGLHSDRGLTINR